jgi:hypothetical protein
MSDAAALVQLLDTAQAERDEFRRERDRALAVVAEALRCPNGMCGHCIGVLSGLFPDGVPEEDRCES